MLGAQVMTVIRSHGPLIAEAGGDAAAILRSLSVQSACWSRSARQAQAGIGRISSCTGASLSISSPGTWRLSRAVSGWRRSSVIIAAVQPGMPSRPSSQRPVRMKWQDENGARTVRPACPQAGGRPAKGGSRLAPAQLWR
jgi:hypothetical protein